MRHENVVTSGMYFFKINTIFPPLWALTSFNLFSQTCHPHCYKGLESKMAFSFLPSTHGEQFPAQSWKQMRHPSEPSKPHSLLLTRPGEVGAGLCSPQANRERGTAGTSSGAGEAQQERRQQRLHTTLPCRAESSELDISPVTEVSGNK